MLSILASSGASSAAGMGGMILWLVILFAFMYFFMIRPQKKETQKKNAMLYGTCNRRYCFDNKWLLRYSY